MVLEQNSNQPSVNDFFGHPVGHHDVMSKYFPHDEIADSENINEHLSKYLNEKAIVEMIKVNSEITKVFSKFKLPIKINMKILDNLVNNHMRHAREIAIGIANCLAPDVRIYVNYKALAEATSLHDLAKVIIPENILNKKGRLEGEEIEIMRTHSELSYEMLKSTDLAKETLHLIKNHHEEANNTQQSYTDKDFIANINLQILSIADVYSALREKRSYKPAMCRDEALKIIHDDVQNDKYHICVFEALCKYTRNQEESAKINNQGKVSDFKSVDSFGS